jgi:hypothetical protein
MLLVTVDWAIGDGTLLRRPVRPLVGSLFREMERACWRGGFQGDGRYRPIERLDIVLAGDSGDWLTSRVWIDTDLRPWRSCRRTAAAIDGVAVASLKRSLALMAGLARRVRHGVMVPRADARGRPVLGGCRRIPVTVSLLAGDRDAWIETSRVADVARRLGIHVGWRWESPQLTIVHADSPERVCCGSDVHLAGEGSPPTLFQTVTVGLVARFLRAVISGEAGLRDPAPIAHLADRLTSAPLLQLPWVLSDWMARQPGWGPGGSRKKRLVELWYKAVSAWHREADLEGVADAGNFDLVSACAAWLEDLQGLSGSGQLLEERWSNGSTGPGQGSLLRFGMPSFASDGESAPMEQTVGGTTQIGGGQCRQAPALFMIDRQRPENSIQRIELTVAAHPRAEAA